MPARFMPARRRRHPLSCPDHSRPRRAGRRWSRTSAAWCEAAPLFTPAMPRTGKEMSVRMTNCGALGWVTDKERGYRYQATHPVTGQPWPPIPRALLDLWRRRRRPSATRRRPASSTSTPSTAKMGLHQDRDEQRSFRPPSSRSRSATTACSASAAPGAPTATIVLPAAHRRCRRARRRGPARLPRRRPHLSRRPRRC